MRAVRHEVEVRRYLWRALEVVIILAFIVLVALLLDHLMKYILPFVIGWVFAILLIPVVRFLERRQIPRLTAVLLVMVVTVLVVVGISIGIIVGTLREATSFIANSQSFLRIELSSIQHTISTGKVFYGKLPVQFSDQVQATVSQFVHSIEVGIRNSVGSLVHLVTSLPETLFVFVIAVVTAFFILYRRERMLASFFRLVPPGWDRKLDIILVDMEKAFLGTIRVQFILMCLSAVLGVIGMLILHFPYAVLLGILFALTGLVPILGSALLTVPWAIGAFALGDPSTAIKVLALQVVISLIRHAIEPKILAETVGLDTLSTLFALYVGLKIIGIIGLFIGPIILIGAKGLLRTRLFIDFLPHHASVEPTEDEWRGD